MTSKNLFFHRTTFLNKNDKPYLEDSYFYLEQLIYDATALSYLILSSATGNSKAVGVYYEPSSLFLINERARLIKRFEQLINKAPIEGNALARRANVNYKALWDKRYDFLEIAKYMMHLETVVVPDTSLFNILDEDYPMTKLSIVMTQFKTGITGISESFYVPVVHCSGYDYSFVFSMDQNNLFVLKAAPKHLHPLVEFVSALSPVNTKITTDEYLRIAIGSLQSIAPLQLGCSNFLIDMLVGLKQLLQLNSFEELILTDIDNSLLNKFRRDAPVIKGYAESFVSFISACIGIGGVTSVGVLTNAILNMFLAKDSISCDVHLRNTIYKILGKEVLNKDKSMIAGTEGLLHVNLENVDFHNQEPTAAWPNFKIETEEEPVKDPEEDPEEDPDTDPDKKPKEDPDTDPNKDPDEEPDEDPKENPDENSNTDPKKDKTEKVVKIKGKSVLFEKAKTPENALLDYVARLELVSIINHILETKAYKEDTDTEKVLLSLRNYWIGILSIDSIKSILSAFVKIDFTEA